MPNPLPLTVTLLLLALSGCLSPSDPAPAAPASEDPVIQTLTGSKSTSSLHPSDLVLTPSQKIGSCFAIHVWTSRGAPDGSHSNLVLVEETPDAWIHAPDSNLAAKEQAVTDLPVMGCFLGSDLSSTAYDAGFGRFGLPLFDDHT